MASISKPSRSLRRKTMPVPAAAGRIRRVTAAPLWSPMPLHSTGVRTVCSNGKLFQRNRLHRTEYQPMLYFCHTNRGFAHNPRLGKTELLLFFHRSDFGHGWVKQRIRRMDVVGDIQNNL